jgi:hypothetical protein
LICIQIFDRQRYKNQTERKATNKSKQINLRKKNKKRKLDATDTRERRERESGRADIALVITVV